MRNSCCKFLTFSSSERILKIGQDLTQLEAKSGFSLFMAHSVQAGQQQNRDGWLAPDVIIKSSHMNDMSSLRRVQITGKLIQDVRASGLYCRLIHYRRQELSIVG